MNKNHKTMSVMHAIKNHKKMSIIPAMKNYMQYPLNIVLLESQHRH